MTRAVVFAYHNVGVRCLRVLLARGVEVGLVVTHQDSPRETIWFESVARVAEEQGIALIVPDDPNTEVVRARVAAARPDFLFSFYYRHLLKESLLTLPSRGALNMHGSLLPKYRGRVPVNWAIIKGEAETGATLHYMTVKPDAGNIVAQRAVPILPDDTAREVFDKVTVAAELALFDVLPALVAGTAPSIPQDLSQGGYFGGRKPEDGEIDWRQNARAIHDLVRAVAPPYPGATTTLAGLATRVLRSTVLAGSAEPCLLPTLEVRDGHLLARCGAGGLLRVLAFEVEGQPLDAAGFVRRFGSAPVPLPS
ncbi:MAG: formyltransferase [Betaproteobacteria bacterium]|nr:formyltransferase [Betaproteobacteria bacterium]